MNIGFFAVHMHIDVCVFSSQENVGFRFSQVEDWTDGPQDADLDLGASSLQGRGDGGGVRGGSRLVSHSKVQAKGL